MKTIFFILALSCLTLSGFTQTEANPQNTVTHKTIKLSKNYFYLSPFNLIAQQFLVGYERDFGSRHSIVFQQGAILGSNSDYYYYPSQSKDDWGLTSELQYRYHIVSVTNPRAKAKNAFRFDFYAAPFVGYQYLSYYSETYYYDDVTGTETYIAAPKTSQAASTGLLFGTRFTFFERFTIDAYAGGGMKFSNPVGGGDSYNYSIFKPNYRGIIGKANLQIGMAF